MTTTKTPLRQPTAAPAYARRQDVSREITSEHIARHVEAFEASGGTVEVLGNTPMLKRVKTEAPSAFKPKG